MGIISNDIAAQRAMLKRGEEKRKADWKQAERERLRDTFAAAALSGILTKDDAAQLEKMASWWPEWACSAAYRWADAMLRERERHHIPDAGKMVENTTNHDAAPDATARTDADRHRTDKAARRPGEGTGDTTLDGAPAVEAGAGKPQISHPQAGNTQTAPPCVETDGPPSQGEGLNIPDSRTRLSEAEIDALEYVVGEGRIASMDDYGILRSLLVRVRPEWESQSYKKSDEKRVVCDTKQEPVAWAILHLEHQFVSLLREVAEARNVFDAPLVPLYRSPTLTDEEREAIEQVLNEINGTHPAASWVPATLRKLLTRLAVK